MNKKLLATSMLVVTSIAMPTLAQFTVSVGAQSTQMFVESENKLHTNLLGSSFPILDLSTSADDEATELGGELAIGYQYNYNPLYNVAIEIFGQLGGTNVDTPIYPEGSSMFTTTMGAPDVAANLSFDWIAGLRMRPGVYVTPKTRLFIDGGFVWGGFELEQSADVVNYWENLGNVALEQNQNEILFGWRYGAGVEYKFTDVFVMGVDYTITEFSDLNSDFQEDVSEISAQKVTGGQFLLWSSEYVPTIHTLGLNFKFLLGGKKKQPTPPPMRVYPLQDK